MKNLTKHLWFETPHRRDYLNITDKVERLVGKSGVQEGLCLINAMHITGIEPIPYILTFLRIPLKSR